MSPRASFDDSKSPGPHGYGPEITDVDEAALLRALDRLEQSADEIQELVSASDAPSGATDVDALKELVRRRTSGGAGNASAKTKPPRRTQRQTTMTGACRAYGHGMGWPSENLLRTLSRTSLLSRSTKVMRRNGFRATRAQAQDLANTIRTVGAAA